MSRAGDERGMTMIEIMLSVSILGVILVPIAAAMMLGFMTSSGTREQITDSSSAQLLSSYAPTDIQSAKWVIDVDPAPAPPLGTSCANGGTPLLRLEWDDPVLGGGGPRSIVVYEQRPDGSTGPSLFRVRCDGSGVVQDDSRLVRSLASFTVTCTRDDNPAPGACPTQPEGDSPSAVRKVILAVTADNPTVNDTIYEAYSFQIEATRRVTTVAP